MRLRERIVNRLDRRILAIHTDARVKEDDPSKPPLMCRAHPEPVPWPCDDWYAALARLKARKHLPTREGA